jgi:serine/threonine protein kinase
MLQLTRRVAALLPFIQKTRATAALPQVQWAELDSCLQLYAQSSPGSVQRASLELKLLTGMTPVLLVVRSPRSAWPADVATKCFELLQLLAQNPPADADLLNYSSTLHDAFFRADKQQMESLRQSGPLCGMPKSRSLLRSIAHTSLSRSARAAASAALVAHAMCHEWQDPGSRVARAHNVQSGSKDKGVDAAKIKLPLPANLAKWGPEKLKEDLAEPLRKRSAGAPLRLSLIEASEGRSFVVASRFSKGGYGKARVALPLHRDGDAPSELPVVLKELRRDKKKYQKDPALFGRQATRPTSDDKAHFEYSSLQQMHGSTLAQSYFTTKKSNFLALTLMQGNLLSLINAFNEEVHAAQSPCTLSDLFEQAGLQLTVQLAGYHAKSGSICPDIKLENILVHPSHGFMLADPGDPGKFHPKLNSYTDSVNTIMYLPTEVLTTEHRTQASDTWALGLVLSSIVAPHNHPFLAPDAPRRHSGGYETWHRSLGCDGQNTLSIRHLKRSSAGPFKRYFTGLYAQHPDFCQVLLAKILQPDLSQRWSSQELATWFALRYGTEVRSAVVKEYLTAHTGPPVDPATLEILQVYRDQLLSVTR